MRRLAVRAAIVAGIVILVVEGYFLYSFYSASTPAPTTEERPSERPSERATGRGEETGGADQKADGGRTQTEERTQTGGRTETEGREEPRPEPVSVAGYLEEIGALQAESVGALDDSGEKLLRYDTLGAADVEAMEENRATLGRALLRAKGLDVPDGYADHHELFVSAVRTMREASEVAHRLAADPVDATRSGFDEHRRLVDEADALLRRSNEMIGRDYDTPAAPEGEGL